MILFIGIFLARMVHMVKYENECVSCGFPCLGHLCPHQNVPHYYCDCCKEEFVPEELFFFDGDALCIDCVQKKLEPAYP